MSTTNENSWSSNNPPKQLDIRLPSIRRMVIAIPTSPYHRRLFMGLSVVGFFFAMLIALFGAGGWIDNWNKGGYVTRGSWFMVIANSLGFSTRYHAGLYGYFFAVFCSIVFVIFWAGQPVKDNGDDTGK